MILEISLFNCFFLSGGKQKNWKTESSVTHSCVKKGEAWAPWTEWSGCKCSESKKSPYKSRNRECIDSDILGCEGEFVEELDCSGKCSDYEGKSTKTTQKPAVVTPSTTTKSIKITTTPKFDTTAAPKKKTIESTSSKSNDNNWLAWSEQCTCDSFNKDEPVTKRVPFKSRRNSVSGGRVIKKLILI